MSWLKSVLVEAARARLVLAHMNAKSTIRTLGEDLVQELGQDIICGTYGYADDGELKKTRSAEAERELASVVKSLNKLEKMMNTKTVEKTNCENCSAEIPTEEVQSCEVCGMDGLGNCCIGVDDHPCEDAEDED